MEFPLFLKKTKTNRMHWSWNKLRVSKNPQKTDALDHQFLTNWSNLGFPNFECLEEV